jgi:hypothetical protein
MGREMSAKCFPPPPPLKFEPFTRGKLGCKVGWIKCLWEKEGFPHWLEMDGEQTWT